MSVVPGALFTDLYQLTMAQAYHQLGMGETAVFELFVRRLPPQRRFLVVAGIEQALEFAAGLGFTGADLDYLAGLGRFSRGFLDHLAALRFSGSIHAMPEGTPFFADEPIMRVTAPILEAQLLESRLMNIVHFQTLVASKAARCVLAAGGRYLVDFGLRRAHEASAALFAARAAYLAGFDATATVEAGRRFGIPLSGTLAHSFIEAHASEAEAFRCFACSQPGATTLLIDTYDCRRAARRVVELAQELKRLGSGHGIGSVRIDSGDLAAQAREVRAILDAGGCPEIRIVLSGGLDERAIESVVARGAPVDAFGVGTALDVSADVPALDMAYKLQEYAGLPRRKRSPGKETWPGAKQVFREYDADGRYTADEVRRHEEGGRGEPLLNEVMSAGVRVGPQPTLATAREHCRRQLAALPAALRSLEDGGGYPVSISAQVRAEAARLDESLLKA